MSESKGRDGEEGRRWSVRRKQTRSGSGGKDATRREAVGSKSGRWRRLRGSGGKRTEALRRAARCAWWTWLLHASVVACRVEVEAAAIFFRPPPVGVLPPAPAPAVEGKEKVNGSWIWRARDCTPPAARRCPDLLRFATPRGTTAVVLAGIIAALKSAGGTLADHTFWFFSASYPEPCRTPFILDNAACVDLRVHVFMASGLHRPVLIRAEQRCFHFGPRPS
ncbi:NADP-dependent malic enzyme 4 chloroplastic [Zea mays]|uniref:NADP-dependent malic enzyme 4 chloroplastic n=1 Tax=Zea mays TaxID=4577 RepID=A0A1D6Q5D5_MAIZE|nr:NADP-dependent malic enzyme 4 chloroplastic [Zea mays]